MAVEVTRERKPMSKQFKKGFVWGASTASYQIEGAAREDGRGPSIWDTFSHTPGKVANGDTGDVACDHYHRYPEDIALMKRLGISSYRFSTAWPRILPQGKGQVNQAGLDFYDRLVDSLLAAEITPWLCFYHWDLPQALQDLDGWQNRDIASWFTDYAMTVHRQLGDRVKRYATFNEANVISVLGHATGEHAPGLASREATFKTIHHINLSHGKAIMALRDDTKELTLGIVNNLGPTVPASGSEADKKAAAYADAIWNRSFPDPQFLGRYPALLEEDLAPYLRAEDLATIHQPLDFFGVNHYFPSYTKHDPDAVLGYSNVPPPEGRPVTGMGWEISPQAFYEQLMDIHQRYGSVPIYVTENGAGYEETVSPDGQINDDYRAAFLEGYLSAMHRAIDAGADVRGYFVWSLLDNFEWAFGYAKRFGLVHIDYATLKRTPKKSFEYYRQVAAANALQPAS
jgi:beta-glucosidase